MRHLACLPLALLLATSAAAQDHTGLTPEQLGEVFCIGRVASDMAVVAGILTPELSAAIADAEARNAAWEEANPGEKPPLGDGIPWQAWPDYASQCMVEQVSFEMDEARVWIAYSYSVEPSANFSDVLNLRLVPGPYGSNVWRLDNVGYATDGDLRTALVSAFMD